MPPLCAVDWCIACAKHGSKYCAAHTVSPSYEPKGRHGRERADVNDGNLDFDDVEDDDLDDEDEDDETDEDEEDYDESDLEDEEDFDA